MFAMRRNISYRRAPSMFRLPSWRPSRSGLSVVESKTPDTTLDASNHSFGHVSSTDGPDDVGHGDLEGGDDHRPAKAGAEKDGSEEEDDDDEQEDPKYNEASDCTHLLFMTLEHHDYDDTARAYGYLMLVVIVLSCAAFILGTLDRFKFTPDDCPEPLCRPSPDNSCTHTICPPQPLAVLHRIEGATIVFFTIDYVIRVATVGFMPNRLIYPERFLQGKISGREPSFGEKLGVFVCRPFNLIDLAAVLPFYIHLMLASFTVDLDFLRLLRMARVFRILKMARYTDSSNMVSQTMHKSLPALFLLLFFVLLLTTVFGTLVFFFEDGKWKATPEYPDGAYFRPTANGQGEEVSPFTNIIIASYWVIMTATTVGYGDFYPTTTGGRCVSVLCAFAGIICIALPMTIIGRFFNETWDSDERLKAVEREYLHKDHAQVLKHMKHLLPAPLHKRVEAALAKAAAEAAGKKTEEVTQGEEDEALPLTGQSGEEGANSDANKGGHGLKEEQEEDDHEDSKEEEEQHQHPHHQHEGHHPPHQRQAPLGDSSAVSRHHHHGHGLAPAASLRSPSPSSASAEYAEEVFELRRRELSAIIRGEVMRMEESSRFVLERLEELERMVEARTAMASS